MTKYKHCGRENIKPVEAPPVCDHKWLWTLRSGEPWVEPEPIESYCVDLIIGKCSKCGQTHKPIHNIEIV